MKGLLLKDYYNLKKTGKTTIFILLVYGIFGIVSGQVSMLSAMVALMCAILPISTFSFDDFAKWDIFALSMPISRKTIILSKYLGALILIAIGALLSLLMNLLGLMINGMDDGEISIGLSTIGTVVVICLFVIAVIFPVIIKYGVEKGRIAMIAVFLIPTMAFMLFAKTGGMDLIPSGDQLRNLILGIAVAAPLVALLALVLSFFLTLKIYSAKEF